MSRQTTTCMGRSKVITVTFTVLGGLFAIRIGLVRALFASGIAMALPPRTPCAGFTVPLG